MAKKARGGGGARAQKGPGRAAAPAPAAPAAGAELEVPALECVGRRGAGAAGSPGLTCAGAGPRRSSVFPR